MFHAARRSQALVALCLGLTLMSCAPTQERADPAAERTDVVGARKVIALLPNAQSTNRMRQTAQSTGYQELDVARLDGLGLTMLTFQMPDGITGAEAIADLEAAVPESTVGINHAYRLQQGTQAPGALNYAGTLMRWQEGGCRARAPIGIVDTAVDTSSPALQGAEVVARTFFDGNAAAATHGTDVAALLADPERLRGVKIYAANVFGQPDAAGPVAGAGALVRALDWFADENVRFVNLALAGPYNKLLDLAVDRAADRGLVLVAAVGNDGPRVDPLYPAGFSDVIAVTAVDAGGRIYRDAVRGSHVDIAAPGVDILVPIDGPPRLITGTSIATPFVTARLVADPSVIAARSVADVRNRLATTSAELGPEGRDPVFGYGLALASDICSD